MNRLAQQVADTAQQIADCVCAAVADIGGGPVCMCGVVASPVPSWDYCGQCSGATCGMAYVVVTQAFPFEAFPEPLDYSRCDRPLAVTVAVGVLRCAPMIGEDGTLPNDAEHWEAAQVVTADMGAVYEALTCCGFPDLAVGAWTSVPETGGCIGGRWEFTVGLDG